MVSAHDVAAYILKETGEMTAMKLQKLVYYSQAWSLVWDDRPLFEETIEAWANGPVVPALYQSHRGKFKVLDWPEGDATKLSLEEEETIDAILQHYGPRSSQWLSELTHKEQPWVEARGDLAPGERGNSVISHAAMAEYYGSLV
jgi:uncharacterized phage-associated protein